MAKLIREIWHSRVESGLPRRDRRSCSYDAYVPDLLVGRPLRIDAEVAADIAEAETAIVQLNARHGVLADTETLARLLLRAEAVASSRIEGLEVGPRRLLRAEAAERFAGDRTDVTATEVLGNIQAMAWATGHAMEVLQVHAIREHPNRLTRIRASIGGCRYSRARAGARSTMSRSLKTISRRSASDGAHSLVASARTRPRHGCSPCCRGRRP